MWFTNSLTSKYRWRRRRWISCMIARNSHTRLVLQIIIIFFLIEWFMVVWVALVRTWGRAVKRNAVWFCELKSKYITYDERRLNKWKHVSPKVSLRVYSPIVIEFRIRYMPSYSIRALHACKIIFIVFTRKHSYVNTFALERMIALLQHPAYVVWVWDGWIFVFINEVEIYIFY